MTTEIGSGLEIAERVLAIVRDRAGAAGWPVCPTWPGWPLPQFGVPQATISFESMSMLCQNTGPMPV